MRLFQSIIVLAIITLVSCVQKRDKTNDSKPNVIFIYADDMGYGEVQALNPERGKIPTPNLNRLAKEGMIFTDAHTSSSVCTPSRYALLTGRYNWRTRLQRGVVGDGGEPLIAEGRLTLGHLFQEQGYSSSIVGKWHLDYHYQIPEGEKLQARRTETHYYAPVPVGTKITDGPVTRGFESFYGFHRSESMSSIVQNDMIVKEIPVVEVLPDLTREVVRQIDVNAEDAKQGKPFFIYFALNSPHSPIVPAPEWIGKGGLGLWSDYIAQSDGSVGEVMSALERNGLTENTILIFSSDNGSTQLARFTELEAKGHYSSAELRGAKADLWDGGHRVPFILRWPAKVQENTTCDQLVCLSDMMTTFAELFSAELMDNTAEDSYSFFPALLGEAIPNPRINIVHHSVIGRFSIRQENWKLLIAPGSGGRGYPGDFEAIQEGLPEMQLYDMGRDIGEQENLVNDYPEKVEELIGLLESYVENGRSTPGAIQSNDAPIDIWKPEANENPTHKRWRTFPIK